MYELEAIIEINCGIISIIDQVPNIGAFSTSLYEYSN